MSEGQTGVVALVTVINVLVAWYMGRRRGIEDAKMRMHSMLWAAQVEEVVTPFQGEALRRAMERGIR